MTQRNITKQWNEMRKEIESLVKKGQTSVKEVQKQVDTFIKSAEKDFNGIVDKDIPKLVTRLKKDRVTLERRVEKMVHQEIKKAKKFLDDQRKELNKLQKNIESYLPVKAQKKESPPKKTATKKVAKKATNKKKVVKKAQAKTAKKVAKKPLKKSTAKSTKKVSKKTAKKTVKKTVKKTPLK